MKTVPILFTFDQSLVMPACVCITSLLQNAKPDTFYDIFILHGPSCDFSKSILIHLPDVYSNCRISFRTVRGEFVGGYEIRGIPETAYYRLIAPELIPEYDKILYSDVDVIFREDLGQYYDIDLGECYFGGVDNCGQLRPEVQEYVKKTLGLDYRNGYYYSGNLIINSSLILRDDKTKEFRELGKNNYSQQDMDIMNIACNGRFLPLGPSYCLTNLLYSLIVNRRDEMEAIYGSEELDHALQSGIVHYNGAKPWKEDCLNLDIWWRYYRQSICFDEQFCQKFWSSRQNALSNLSLKDRLKLTLRGLLSPNTW